MYNKIHKLFEKTLYETMSNKQKRKSPQDILKSNKDITLWEPM